MGNKPDQLMCRRQVDDMLLVLKTKEEYTSITDEELDSVLNMESEDKLTTFSNGIEIE